MFNYYKKNHLHLMLLLPSHIVHFFCLKYISSYKSGSNHPSKYNKSYHHIFFIPKPSIVVNTIAANINGIDINISVILINTSSNHPPPKYAATDPTKRPIAVEIATTIKPISKAVLVPQITP